MNKYIIYKYTSPSQKIYIGQTNQGLKRRAYNGEGYKHSIYFYNAIKKYGWENFKSQILKQNLNKQQANYWEEYYIKYYQSNNRNYGYNISEGGNNHTLSPQAKEKISQYMKNNNPMKNPEIAKKVSKKTRGQSLSEQAKKNISQGHKKKILCIETGIIYNSRQEAAKAVKRSPSGIGRAATGQQKTCANLHWRYINDD